MNSPHTLSWFELPVSDIYRAKKFYETIFDIKLELFELSAQFKMALFHDGALVWNTAFYHPSSSQGPLLHFNANPDLKVIQDRIEEAGGTILVSKREIGSGKGYMAVFEDTEGNRVALHSSK